MSGTVSFAELDRQHGELLPARTVLSMFGAKGPDSPIPGGGDVGALVSHLSGLGGTNSGADGTNTDGTSGTDKS